MFQHMLFKAIFIQVGFTVLILIVPIGITLICSALGRVWTSKLAFYTIMFISLHAAVEFSCTIYYIKPYRQFVKGVFDKILIKIHLKNQTLSSNTTVFPSSGFSLSINR